ncbi:MAG: DegT/DnrJ/EryC1/StrS aminotransferase family protein [Armatimonadota bacterium]
MKEINTNSGSKTITEPGPWPHFAPDEVEAVTAVLKSGKVNYWTGEVGRIFEKEFAQAVGCEFGVALHNGSLALELALHALGIMPGDEVVVTPRTFLASASAAVVRGSKPVFADVDRDSGNITAAAIEAVLTPKTKAIITVHLAGWPCDMDPILALAKKHNLKVIEDCAQCHGAAYKGRPCGSLGDAAAWSFCQDKIMTTGGEGGMLTTGDPAVWEKAWAYKDHGKSYDAVYNREHAPGFRWLHESFGTNWRMLEVQAAIGRVQLTKLDGWVDVRRRNAAVLIDSFSEIPALRVPVPSSDFGHAYYKFYAYVVPERLKDGWSRDRIMVTLNSLGISCTVGSCSEIYLEKAFADAGLQPPERLPVARELGETALMFLVHPTLTEGYMHHVADSVKSVMKEASR